MYKFFRKYQIKLIMYFIKIKIKFNKIMLIVYE